MTSTSKLLASHLLFAAYVAVLGTAWPSVEALWAISHASAVAAVASWTVLVVLGVATLAAAATRQAALAAVAADTERRTARRRVDLTA